MYLESLALVVSILVYQSLHQGYDTAYGSCDLMISLNSLYERISWPPLKSSNKVLVNLPIVVSILVNHSLHIYYGITDGPYDIMVTLNSQYVRI